MQAISPGRKTDKRCSVRPARLASQGKAGGSTAGQGDKANFPRTATGFSIVEILIVVAILTIIFGFSVGIGSNFYSGQALIAERDSVIGLLRNARTRAMDNVNQLGHGVYIGANQYVAFDGESYAARIQDYDAAFPRFPGVTIAGPSEIVFKSIEGTSNVSGTIIISSGAGSANISLNNEGRINW